jgi:hypothetical protein
MATVSSGGSVTGVTHGSVTITASMGSVKSKGFGMNVIAVLQSIAVSGASSLHVGLTTQLTATAKYNDGSSTDISSTATWGTSSSSMATVSSAGLVTGVTHGSVTITASMDSVTSGGFGMSIIADLLSISISPTNSTVFVDSTLQYSGTGNYNDGTSTSITGLTWSSSDKTKATIGSTGLASGVYHGSVTITGTYQGFNATAPLSVVALITGVTIDPIGPGILVNGSQTFSLTATYNDNSPTQNVASTAAWASSDNSKSTVSAGVAQGVAPGAVTITGTATGADGTTYSAATALDIVNPLNPPPNLKGDYAFTLTSADTRGPVYYAGSFTADGNGNISGGVLDVNSDAGVLENVQLSGTYLLYPDGRGNINFNANSIFSNGAVYRFILSTADVDGNYTLGKMIEWDGLGTTKGSFELQDPSSYQTSAFTGSYIFRLTGIDGTIGTNGNSQPIGQVGYMALDGSGDITAGNVDSNDYGKVSPLVPLDAGQTYSFGANGRGTMGLSETGVVRNYVVYAINANKFNLIQVDAGDATSAMAGVAELQSGGPYQTSSLNGPYAIQLQRPAQVNPNNGYDRREFGSVGSYSYDGFGAMMGTRDDANNGNNNPLTGITGDYAISGQNGRGTVNATSTVNFRAYSFYMVNPAKMYMLQTFTTGSQDQGSLNAPVGIGVQQVGVPFGPNNLDGSYTVDLSDLTVTYTEALMRMSFDGATVVDGIADLSLDKAISAVVLDATYSINANSTTGRGTIVLPAPLGANNYVFYLNSSQNAFLLGLTPDAEGSVTLQ